jgi:hypothetical protein
METDPEFWIIGDYGENNEELIVEKLTEIFSVCYTIKKKGKKEPEEIYTFTTDFEQAFKRFKLLPHTKCFLKRFLTDDPNLIKLAQDGTKPKINIDDLTDEQKAISLGEILDTFRDEDDEGNAIREIGFKVKEANEEIREAMCEAIENLDN